MYNEGKKGVNVAYTALKLLADKRKEYPNKQIVFDQAFRFANSEYHATRSGVAHRWRKFKKIRRSHQDLNEVIDFLMKQKPLLIFRLSPPDCSFQGDIEQVIEQTATHWACR